MRLAVSTGRKNHQKRDELYNVQFARGRNNRHAFLFISKLSRFKAKKQIIAQTAVFAALVIAVLQF